jgi:hypothetical protein
MAQQDSEKNPISQFGYAEQLAIHLLREAFWFAHEAAAYEIAGQIFRERIATISPAPEWVLSTDAIPTGLKDWLSTRERTGGDMLDPVTLDRLAEAWQMSQREARKSDRKIRETHKLSSTNDVVSHVINLATCVEAVTNRHLFYLRESGKLDSDHYKLLDRAELMAKILFCFKEEIQEKKLHLSSLKYLIALRNRAVHFKVDSPEGLVPTIEQLKAAWRDVGLLFSRIEGEPTQEQLADLTKRFVERWIAA